MARAVRYDQFGPVDVLRIAEVDRPVPGAGEVVVEVVSAGINPGEDKIRLGMMHSIFPSTFPSGQGSDFAGRVVGLGDGVTGFAVGDEVVGFTNSRASHADYVLTPAGQVTPKPAAVSWDEAGGLFVAGTTAYAAVRAVALKPGETVVVSGAAGGVGSLAVQLAHRAGAQVIGIAGDSNRAFLEALGVTHVSYGDGLADRLRAAAPDGIDALIDTYGSGYVELGLDLGVAPERIDTIADFAAVAKFGVKAEGSAAASEASVIAELADLIASKDLVLPVAATYPLEQVREAYTELAKGHTRGKIVLRLR